MEFGDVVTIGVNLVHTKLQRSSSGSGLETFKT